MAELVWLVRHLFAIKVLWNFQVLNSLLELCIVFRARIKRRNWLEMVGWFSFSWNSLAEGVFDWGQLPRPQLLVKGFLSFGCLDSALDGWIWLELFETIGTDWQWGVCGRGPPTSPQLAGEYVNFTWVWHGMVGTGWNWLNIVGLDGTHWQWLAMRRLW